MKNTKIDWCDCTVNPIVGCKNGCEYCYAKKINDRFHFIPCWEEPKFFPERLKQLESKKSKSVFMDSMSDIGFWDWYWKDQVQDFMVKNRQHRYIFLTKCYKALRGIYKNWEGLFAGKGKIAYLGASITNQKQLKDFEAYAYREVDFLSIEPIAEPIKFEPCCHYLTRCKLFIIGAETGNRKDKVIPNKEWIDDIVEFCDTFYIKVFMKESLREIMGEDFRQDKLPWDCR